MTDLRALLREITDECALPGCDRPWDHAAHIDASGMGGRPFGRDFHRQNSRNPFRCQRMRVSGSTTTRRRVGRRPLS